MTWDIDDDPKIIYTCPFLAYWPYDPMSIFANEDKGPE